jgi:hypothetical protein
MTLYRAFDLVIASDWPLPLPTSEDVQATTRFYRDDTLVVDYPLPNTIGQIRYGHFQDKIGIHVPWVGFYEVRGVGEVVVKPNPEAKVSALALYYTGLVITFQLRLRPCLCFHGSAVVTPQGAVCFVGHQGAGKSTTAAGLTSRGLAMLCDDVIPIQSGPRVLPGIPRPKLLPDAYEKLVGNPELAQEAFDGVDKYHADLLACYQEQPLRTIFLLTPEESAPSVSLEPVKGRLKFTLLMEHLQAVVGLDDPAVQFQRLGEWLGQVPLVRVLRPAKGDHLSEVLDNIQKHLNQENTL